MLPWHPLDEAGSKLVVCDCDTQIPVVIIGGMRTEQHHLHIRRIELARETSILEKPTHEMTLKNHQTISYS